MSLRITVKNTAGARFDMDVPSLSETVAEFKARLATESGIPASSQRLIFRGHILKDSQTFNDIKAKHGLESGQSMHVVPSPSAARAPPSTTTPSDPATHDAHPQQPAGGPSPRPGGAGGFPDMMEMQQQMMRNPEQMQAMMNSPLMENIMNNPQVARSLMMANPQMRELLERNPEVAHVFNDPSTFRQMMQMARNPSLMNEMMRNTDRQMANIEMMPGGFDALRRMHENIQAPLMDATQGFAPGNGDANPNAGNNQDDNPFTSLFQQNTPSNTPMPNPWAPNNGVPTAPPTAAPRTQPTPGIGTNAGEGAGNAFAQLFQGMRGANGGTTPGATPTFPGMGTGGMPNLPPGMDMDQVMQMMEDPMMQEMMQGLLSDPQMFQAMVNNDPTLRTTMESNPQMAQMLQNPEMWRSMLNPDVIRSMRQLQNAFGGMGMGMPGATPTTTPAQTGQTPATAQPPSQTPTTNGSAGAPTMNSFMAMMNAMAAAGGGGAAGAPQPEMTQEQLEEMYSSQLQQLRDMGFLDKSMCLQALQQSRGNVSAAIENLLSRFGG